MFNQEKQKLLTETQLEDKRFSAWLPLTGWTWSLHLVVFGVGKGKRRGEQRRATASKKEDLILIALPGLRGDIQHSLAGSQGTSCHSSRLRRSPEEQKTPAASSPGESSPQLRSLDTFQPIPLHLLTKKPEQLGSVGKVSTLVSDLRCWSIVGGLT